MLLRFSINLLEKISFFLKKKSFVFTPAFPPPPSLNPMQSNHSGLFPPHFSTPPLVEGHVYIYHTYIKYLPSLPPAPRPPRGPFFLPRVAKAKKNCWAFFFLKESSFIESINFKKFFFLSLFPSINLRIV